MTAFETLHTDEYCRLFLSFSGMAEIGMERWNALGQLVEVAESRGWLMERWREDGLGASGGWNLVTPPGSFKVLAGAAQSATNGDYVPLVALRDGRPVSE